MNITYIAIVEEMHYLRYKYLRQLIHDIKDADDELIVVNKVKDYRTLESVNTSGEDWIKTLDLFNIEDDFKLKMIGSTHAKNEFLAFISPFGYYNSKSLVNIKKELSKGDYDATIFSSGFIVNPLNGYCFKALNKSNVAVNSLIFHKKYLDKIINYNGSANASLYYALRSDGKVLMLDNKLSYVEFIPFYNDSLVEKVHFLDDSGNSINKKFLSGALKYLRKSLIN